MAGEHYATFVLCTPTSIMPADRSKSAQCAEACAVPVWTRGRFGGDSISFDTGGRSGDVICPDAGDPQHLPFRRPF